MDITMFFEFPGILITIGVVLLLISIIIIIIAYKSESKDVDASRLSTNGINYNSNIKQEGYYDNGKPKIILEANKIEKGKIDEQNKLMVENKKLNSDAQIGILDKIEKNNKEENKEVIEVPEMKQAKKKITEIPKYHEDGKKIDAFEEEFKEDTKIENKEETISNKKYRLPELEKTIEEINKPKQERLNEDISDSKKELINEEELLVSNDNIISNQKSKIEPVNNTEMTNEDEEEIELL